MQGPPWGSYGAIGTTGTVSCSPRAHSLVGERKCTHVKKSRFRASERAAQSRGGAGEATTLPSQTWSHGEGIGVSLEGGAEPGDAGRAVGRGAAAGKEGAGTENPSTPHRPHRHPSKHTGTHHQGAKSPACPSKLPRRTRMQEHIHKSCQHVRKEKGARSHSQATAPTPAVVTTLSLPVSSRAWPAAWPGAWPAPSTRDGTDQPLPSRQSRSPGILPQQAVPLCQVAHSPAPGHVSCGGRRWKQLGH